MTPVEWESLGFSAIAIFVIVVFWMLNRKNSKAKLNREFGAYLTKHLLVHRSTPSKLKVLTAKTGKNYLVTGGNGFLGSHIVEALLARGEKNIKIFDMTPSPLFQNEPNVTFIKGDLRNPSDVAKACEGVDIVFHTAALINFWSRLPHDRQPSIDVNVKGTQNLIAACLSNKVKQLISTSTNSILTSYDRFVLHDADEETPLAQPPYIHHYTETKIEKEKLVLGANKKGGLVTAVARAGGLIWGPRDMICMKQFSEQWGTMVYGLSTNETLQDYNYVENIVHGHLLLEAKLDSNPDLVAGQAYYITNCEPMRYLDFHKKVAEIFNGDIKTLPGAKTIAKVSEWLQKIGSGRIPLGDLQKLTPASYWAACSTLTISCKKAQRDLGYKPVYTMAESFKRLHDFVEEVQNPNE